MCGTKENLMKKCAGQLKIGPNVSAHQALTNGKFPDFPDEFDTPKLDVLVYWCWRRENRKPALPAMKGPFRALMDNER